MGLFNTTTSAAAADINAMLYCFKIMGGGGQKKLKMVMSEKVFRINYL